MTKSYIFHRPLNAMRQSGLTLQERQLVSLLRWFSFLFSLSAILFAFVPNQTIYWLSTIGHVIFRWPYQALPESTEHFWRILAVSLLVVLTVISFEAQRNIRQNLSQVKLIVISKLVTSIGYLFSFIFYGLCFAYFAGFVIDFIIFAATFFCYKRTMASRAL